jgi:nucleotide-binding universal stress UspA family protein
MSNQENTMPFIVVGVDGSASAQRALVAAVGQAKLAEAELKVVYVVVLPAMSGYEFGPIDLQDMNQAGEKIVKKAIDELTASFDGNLPVPVSSEVLTGHVGIEMLRSAEADDGAAMVVAGSRGYGGFRSLMLGSVTTYLAHHLTCPLLIIPSEPEE